MSKKIVKKEDILSEYLSLQTQYDSFTNYVKKKIENILIENNIKYQTISGRVKSYDSLNKKLDTMDIPKNLKKIRDISGVRIIFYDEIELNRFKGLIQANFEIIKYKQPEDIMKYDGINIAVSLNDNKR